MCRGGGGGVGARVQAVHARMNHKPTFKMCSMNCVYAQSDIERRLDHFLVFHKQSRLRSRDPADLWPVAKCHSRTYVSESFARSLLSPKQAAGVNSRAPEPI